MANSFQHALLAAQAPPTEDSQGLTQGVTKMPAFSGSRRTWWWPVGQLLATHTLYNHYYHSGVIIIRVNTWGGFTENVLGILSLLEMFPFSKESGERPWLDQGATQSSQWDFVVAMMGKFSKTVMNTKLPICPWFCKPYESKKERMVFWSLVFISEGLRTFGLEKKKKKKPLTPDAGILRPACSLWSLEDESDTRHQETVGESYVPLSWQT